MSGGVIEAASVGPVSVGVWGRNGNHCRGTHAVCALALTACFSQEWRSQSESSTALAVRTRRISRLTDAFPGRLEIEAPTRPHLAGWSLRPSSGYHGVPHVSRSSPVRSTLPASTSVATYGVGHVSRSSPVQPTLPPPATSPLPGHVGVGRL